MVCVHKGNNKMLDEVIISKLQKEKLSNKSGIYGIRNLINNKIYIGSSRNIHSRITNHKCLLRKNKHKNIYLQNSYNKYGLLNFLFFKIEICELEMLLELESKYINFYSSSDPKFGFNMIHIDKDTKRNTHSDKSRRKMSESGKLRYSKIKFDYCKYGHEYTDENTYIRKTGWKSCVTCAKKLTEEKNKLSKEERLRKRINKKTCKNNHIICDENIIIDKFGHKKCLLCRRATGLSWYRKKNKDKLRIKNEGYCLHGHEMTEENIYINKNKTKCCITCKRIACKRYIDRKKNV